MRKKSLKNLIRYAMENVSVEIRGIASHGHIGAGLASEGYFGGYRDALSDVLLVVDDIVPPCRRPEYWREPDPKLVQAMHDSYDRAAKKINGSVGVEVYRSTLEESEDEQ